LTREVTGIDLLEHISGGVHLEVEAGRADEPLAKDQSADSVAGPSRKTRIVVVQRD
jgi:hypothetical protein